MTMPNREDQETTLSQRKTQIKTETSNSSARHDEYVRNERPLIDQVSNKWREGKHPNASKEEIEEGFGICDLEDESSCPNLTRSAILSRRFRRMLFLLLLLAAAAFCLWQWYLRPRLEEEWDYKEGFLLRGNGTFGIAKGGDFDGVRVHELDSRLLPGGKHDPDGKRRLVFVGDIHGCAHELKKLLKEVEFDEETDHLITVGDVISKGPENVEVLEELIRLKASNVRGNHEDRILALVHSTLESTFEPSSAEFSTENSKKDVALLRQLSRHHLEYLRTMPLMIRVPALPLASKPSHKKHSPIAEEILVVHAGLVPAVSLEKQDPYFVMNMRSIHTKTHLPIVEAKAKKGKSKPWHDMWGWYNDRLFRKKSLKDFRIWEFLEDVGSDGLLEKLGLANKKKWPKPQVVVYGHHSKAGLQVTRWSKGLDTGCVKGKELTALVLDATGGNKVVSVGCRDHS